MQGLRTGFCICGWKFHDNSVTVFGKVKISTVGVYNLFGDAQSHDVGRAVGRIGFIFQYPYDLFRYAASVIADVDGTGLGRGQFGTNPDTAA